LAATIILLFLPALAYRALQPDPKPVRVQLHPCGVTDEPELDCIPAIAVAAPRNGGAR
jgi:hypothetical protein